MKLDMLFDESETTDGVTVRVAVSYLEEQTVVEQSRWFWSYHIRIENHREDTVQLLTRHWKIVDGHGEVSHVDGDGVVGEQPVISPGASHDYVSGCPLPTPDGVMEGHYRFLRTDGGTFLVDIPQFWLTTPAVAR
jgi:ApaG protein